VIADYSGVEARGLPWLAKNHAEVEAYRAGIDRYLDAAVSVYGGTREEITPAQRQVGKVLILACGFSGGGGALMAMARGYRLKLKEKEAFDLAEKWHEANPWVRAFARALHAAAFAAVVDAPPGELVRAVGTDIFYTTMAMGGILVLLCRLPSGRVIHYHDVQLTDARTISSRRPRFKDHEALWYGLFAENVTQAACADLLRYGLAVLEGAGLPVVAHVHDEFVVETEMRAGLESDVRGLLQQTPPWAADFPLEVKLSVATRYGK